MVKGKRITSPVVRAPSQSLSVDPESPQKNSPRASDMQLRTGWIETGRCGLCLGEIESLHPHPTEATTRHFSRQGTQKVPGLDYLECPKRRIE